MKTLKPVGASRRVAVAERRVPRAVAPQAVPQGVDPGHPSLYFNRELGWIDFNWRVLSQAMDPEVPLLERVRFVAITCNNLDEFFQKRVGGLKHQEAAGVLTLSRDGRDPTQQLLLIRDAAHAMQEAATRIWEEELCPSMREKAGVVVSNFDELTRAQRKGLNRYFRDHIYPILTPLAVDPGHPFPHISNLSLSLAVMMRNPARKTRHFARLKVPTAQGRWLRVPDSPGGLHFVPLEQVVRQNVSALFRGMEIEGVHVFRVTRTADVGRDDDEAEDLLAEISEELRERRFAPVVRLEVEADMPDELRELLARELDLRPEDVNVISGLLGLADCMEFADLDLPAFRFPRWTPVVPAPLRDDREDDEGRSIFSIIRERDILVHHPYESFTASVQRLIDEAADDPDVIAIKQTLYRTSQNSPIVKALLRAVESGKQVAVLVELTARFDEANNIGWAEVLEQAGVHVTYGLVGLKTHAKVLLVLRRENGQPRTYCHISSGNYNAKTAHVYTDLGLLTAHPGIGNDVVNLFHFLTGFAPDQHYDHLVVAPRDMRGFFESRIEREIAMQREHGTGRIVAKMNALDDVGIIRELYRASQEGVKLDLIVRGHSRLRPGLPGYSDNIRVISIVGRFLEHDRIYYFHNNGDPEVLIGSADWRQRNLDDRVEVLVSVLDPALKGRLTGMLELALSDNRLAWELKPDGQYERRSPAAGETAINYHEALMRDTIERAGDRSRTRELKAM